MRNAWRFVPLSYNRSLEEIVIGYLISKKKQANKKNKQKTNKTKYKIKKRNTKYIIEIKISVLIMI